MIDLSKPIRELTDRARHMEAVTVAASAMLTSSTAEIPQRFRFRRMLPP